MTKRKVKRGDIYYADLSPVIGSEQGGVRPVLILQNDVGNHYSPTVIIAAITAQMQKKKMPTHVQLKVAASASSVLGRPFPRGCSLASCTASL